MLSLLQGGQWFGLPPVHPLLVNFTAALIPASWAFDLLGAMTKRDSLRSAAWWTVLLAAIVTPFTALAGWMWLRSMPDMASGPMRVHQWLGTSAAVIVILLAIWRGRRYRRGAPAGVPYLIVSTLLVAALVVQGHLGATMSFGDSGGGEEQHDGHSAAPSHATPSSRPASSQPTTPGAYQWKDHLDLP